MSRSSVITAPWVIATVRAAVAAGRIPRGRIEQAAERIARLKARV